MTEINYPYVMTAPEIELIEVVRLAHMAHFSLSVTHRDGLFTIRLTDGDTKRFVEAQASSFEECWRVLSAHDLRGMELNLQERIAARGQRVPSHLSVVGGTA